MPDSVNKDPLEERDIQKILDALDDDRIKDKAIKILFPKLEKTIHEGFEKIKEEIITTIRQGQFL